MAKAVAYTKRALRALRRMPANTARLIRDKIALYAQDPAALANNVIRLTGRDELRLRVGDWRVLFLETETEITVLDIGPRGSIF